MNLRNTQPKQLKDNSKDIRFQINDLQCYNETLDDSDLDEYEDNSKYVINIFGIDENNESISVKVLGFKPRFYVQIPKDWDTKKIQIFINTLKGKVKKMYKESLVNHKVLHRVKFRGFTNNEKLKFLKLTFHNTYSLRAYTNVLKKKISIPALSKKPKKYALYETNIEPFIRFCHIKDIKPSGWIKIPKKKYNVNNIKLTFCQAEITTKWNDVEADSNTHIAPLITLSFDIECDSSHGDFPLAKKNYKKLGAELLDNIHKKLKKNDLDKTLYQDLVLNENSEREELVTYLVNLAFKDKINLDDISKVYTNDGIKPKKKELKALIPHLTKHLFIRIVREDNNKELREAVDKTKRIWGDNSIGILEDIASKVGKETGISKQKIMNRIITRDILVEKITGLLDNNLPSLEGDKVIQIGSTVHRYGEQECFLKHIVTLDTCNDIDGAVVVPCKTEEEVLKEWAKFVRELDPDIVTGYNIFGFDFKFIYERAEELDIVFEMGTLGRMANKDLELIEKNLSSSALGENILTFIAMEGRVCLDLLKVIQKDHKLASYKLDNVAENFINGSIKDIIANEKDEVEDTEEVESNFGNVLKISGATDLNEGNYITIFMKNDKYMEGKKFNILKLEDDTITLNEEIDNSILSKKASWRLAKDDIGPKDIFRLQKQDAEGRRIVAKYCIQDCALCNKLINKLSIISNNIGMANVCIVPLSYIFLRGQGVKIFSLVSRECRENNFLLPDLKKPKTDEEKEEEKTKLKYKYDDDSDEEVDEGGYEGAIVLPPNPGIYLETPVVVLDYSSLYPSAMISENLSHDTYVMEEKYNNLPGVDYLDITHDVYEWKNPLIKSKGKNKMGQKKCRFVQFKDGEQGLIPKILQKLLKARKSARKKILYKTVKDSEGNEFSGLYKEKDDIVYINNVEGEKMEFNKENIVYNEDTYNEFEKEVFDGLQLAYKVTANSLYGQIGARTSQIYLKDIAASTTATGRNLLHIAKEKTEEKFEGAKIIYGDTDSIFINFNPKDEKGNILKNKEGLKRSIELGVEAEKYIQNFLKPPHKLEYEKTFWPFILFTKKRYIGDKYEFDLDKYKQTSMGIVLKRRDNADIVKHIYGGIMNIIMKEKDIPKSIVFLKEELNKLIQGKFPMEMLTITKSLKSYYKNPESICHKVLADRIGEREPGNKPLPNERLPYIYIQYPEKKGQKVLQGDKVEHPSFIKQHKLKPDYLFYITNQIQKPVCQIYALIVEQLEGYSHDEDYMNRLKKMYNDKHGEEKANEKLTKKRNEITADILFQDIIREGTNKKNKIRPITSWFKPI
tara:strand:+ start:8579 stop:12487 length:3909 start_codon:yes stop_codon:yes gene_type:complete